MPQTSREKKRTYLFSLHRSQSNHHKQGFSITPSKVSYNLIEPQVLLCVPSSCGCQFHAQVVYLQATFIASLEEAYLSAPHFFCFLFFISRRLKSYLQLIILST